VFLCLKNSLFVPNSSARLGDGLHLIRIGGTFHQAFLGLEIRVVNFCFNNNPNLLGIFDIWFTMKQFIWWVFVDVSHVQFSSTTPTF